MSLLAESPAPVLAPGRDRLPERHLARRPVWTCRVCHAAWPCEPARSGLVTEYGVNVSALGMYLAGMLRSALEDLDRLWPNPGPDMTALYARFLGWLPARRRQR